MWEKFIHFVTLAIPELARFKIGKKIHKQIQIQIKKTEG